jgi:plasmid replication initiation protein
MDYEARKNIEETWTYEEEIPLIPSEYESLQYGKTALVYKRNELIHSSHSLGTSAQKIIAGLLSKVNPTQLKLPEFEFTLSELADLLEVSYQGLSKTLNKATTELQQQVIILPKIKPKTGESYDYMKHGGEKLNWFHKSTYDPTTKIAKFIFHEDVKPYVVELTSNFTKYEFAQICQLSSKYSIRFYELFRRSLTMAHVENGLTKTIRTISLHDLRVTLNLEKKYSRFSDFEARVLKIAQIELEKNTDLKFSYVAIEREGKPNSKLAVRRLRFTIFSNPKKLVNADSVGISDIGTREQVESLKDLYSHLQIKDAMRALSEAMGIGTVVNNKFGYIVAVIRRQADNQGKKKNTEKLTQSVLDINNTDW